MSPFKDFARGFGYFVTGLKLWATKPRLMLLGALPALIVSAFMFLLIWWSVPRTYDWSTAMTGFADGWTILFREGLRITLGVALAIAIILVCIVSFVTVTLLVGSPFYERIWLHTENTLGDFEGAVELSLQQQVRKGIGDVARTLRMALVTSLLAVLIGLIPVVGSIAAAVFVAVRGSRALAVELTGFAADARGWTFDERKRELDSRPLRTLGFSFPCYLATIVPGGAVLAMPAAVVAGTLVIRDAASSRRQGERPLA
jgi:CysZ protein